MSDGDELANRTSQLSITSQQNGNHPDRSMSATAISRLLQEANEMRSQRPLVLPPRAIRDVTEIFIAASKQLRPGELVKDEYFTLFEAVGALEIMDPKMDSGYVAPGDTFAPDFDVSAGLVAGDVLWIMDELLRLEMLFHSGYPLSQTIYTSLHIDRLIAPDNTDPYLFSHDTTRTDSTIEHQLVHIVLRAYCLSLIKCCERTINIVQSQTYFEEEDFAGGLFGREMCPKVDADQAMNCLIEAMDWIDASSLDNNIKHDIKHRLVIREHILFAVEEPVEADSHNWVRLKRHIEKLLHTPHPRGKSITLAFSDKVQRKLATSTPPREIPALTWLENLKLWIQMCDDMKSVRHLSSSEAGINPFHLQGAIWAFAYRSPRSGTFVRAKMQEILFNEGLVAGGYSFSELLYTDMQLLVFVGHPAGNSDIFQIEVRTDKRFQLARLLEEFIEKALPLYQEMFRMFCQNTSRRWRMCSNAVKFWDQLEQEATEFDERFRAFSGGSHGNQNMMPFMTWTKLYKLNHIIWTIQLGFENDLYLSGEMHVMYKTLHQLSVQLDDLLQFMQSVVVDVHARNMQSDMASTSNLVINWMLTEAQTTFTMAKYLGRFYLFLEVTGVIKDGLRTYSKKQYEARMKPMLGLRTRIVPELDTIRSEAKEDTIVSSVVDLEMELTKVRQESVSRAIDKREKQRAMVCNREIGESQKKVNTKALRMVNVAMGAELGRIVQICKDNGRESMMNVDLKDIVEETTARAEEQYHLWWPIPHIMAKK